MKTDNFSNQLRWVILLLAAAVILPTVCLLWFMNQAVKNERLAVRSKLSNVYQGEISRVFGPFLEWINTENQNARTALTQNTPYEAFITLAGEEVPFDCQGLFIYDLSAKEMLYPDLWDDYDAVENHPELEAAIRLEFTEKLPDAALEEYQRIEKSTSDAILYKRCKLAQARIRQKMGQFDSAIDDCEMVQSEPLDSPAHWHLYTAANLKILDLLEAQGIPGDKQADRFNERIQNLLYVLEKIDLVPSDQRIMAFDKICRYAEKYPDLLSKKHLDSLAGLKKRIDLERKSISFLSLHPGFAESDPPYRLIEQIPETHIYGLNLYAGQIKAVRLVDAEAIVRKLFEDLNFPTDICCRIVTPDNNVIAGSPNGSASPLLSFPLASFLDWTVEFYETDGNSNVFENAARRQTSIYIWTGVLAAVLVLSAGGISIRAVNQQIKMNRLKNDFIATVTHELKTPLSSMRLLVDTLLEGNYQDDKTVTEYLQLVANENKRLTHLIDSFLTFSRMERNKQVFDFGTVSPGEIAAAAVEAMQAKFNSVIGPEPVIHEQDGRAGMNMGETAMLPHCDFTCTLDDTLPAVTADKEAMITVLVNLLDNAYKYTNSDKRIELKVYQEQGDICFAVKDNGIGLSPRVQRKIFNRFYQVDSRLSRRSEGCGLGLSIVKFIVDAHKGTITVESHLNQGSVFVVKLPKI